jgi:ADP-ribose pyrophosphatase
VTERNEKAERNRESGREGVDEASTGGGRANGDDPLAWETIDSAVAYACPAFAIRHETVGLPDGTETDFDYLTEPPAVVVLPITSDGDVVLIEEWRQAVGRMNRGLPAGTVESDDADLEHAARRELREETGYEAEDVAALTTVEPLNGAADSVHHYFLAKGCVPTGNQDLDTDESIRATEERYEAFREAVRAGDLRDGRAVLALSYYELFDDR